MGPLLTPDTKPADRFLHLLEPAGLFTFQTFDDNKVRKNMGLARVFHGWLCQFAAELLDLQQQGAGVFVMINKGDGALHAGNKTCRTASNVIAVRALFADLDGAPVEPMIKALQPDIVVESSPGRWHGYYLTRDCPLDAFKLRQQQIAQKFNAGPKVCDLPRVMRLPGFWHQKETPFLTKIIFPE